MEYILIVWLSAQGVPVTIDHYSTIENCKQAVAKGQKQSDGKGLWVCVPKEKKQAQIAQF